MPNTTESKRELIEGLCGNDTALFITQYGAFKIIEVSTQQLEEDILAWSSSY